MHSPCLDWRTAELWTAELEMVKLKKDAFPLNFRTGYDFWKEVFFQTTHQKMKAQRIIGIVLIIGAIVAFTQKFLGGNSGHLDLGMEFFMIVAALLLFLAIRRVIRE